MERPTIVYVHPHLMMRTGATNFVLVTSTGLQEQGWNVVIVTGQADPAIVGNRRLNIVELGGQLPSNPRHWVELPWLERHLFTALDAISNKALFPSVHPANYWAFAYKMARPWVPCIWMCHEPSAFVHSWDNIRSLQGPMRLATMAANPPLQVLDRLLVKQTDYIIANSDFTAENARRIYRRDVDAVVDSGVGPEAFDVPNGVRDSIVCLGSLTRFKRVDLAIRGYALARQLIGSDTDPLTIAGDGPALPALRHLTAELGLEQHVHFLGKVSDVEKRVLYARARIFVSTAPKEPFGLTPVEAMAAGAPVLAPDRGGPSETIVDGETGMLYRSGDGTDLGHKLARLLADPTQLTSMSEAARRRVQNRYTLANTVHSLDHTLQRLLHLTS